MPIRKTDETRLCRTCGVDITQHARYTRWTQCARCYWKGRLENITPVELLLKDRSDTKQQIQEMEKLLGFATKERNQKEEICKSNTPWWKDILGIDTANEQLLNLRTQVPSLHNDLCKLKRKFDGLESQIKTARHVRKGFESAVKGSTGMRKRQQQNTENKAAFDKCAKSVERYSYDRTRFSIRKKDYKRGNRLDNHFRNGFLQHTLAAFDNRCLFCGGTHDLTLDHFAIPKNEGGNFVLASIDKDSIQKNLVVLCRSCNSAKGESVYNHFFDKNKLQRADVCQRRLLDVILVDSGTMSIIKSWYNIRI